MDFPDMMRTVGMEVLWDDAGWSESPNIWTPSREGPDFEQTQRYLAKMGMKWALWFCGRPTAGLMNTKVGSWGDFQWRTDGIGNFDLASDQSYRKQIMRFRTDSSAQSHSKPTTGAALMRRERSTFKDMPT